MTNKIFGFAFLAALLFSADKSFSQSKLIVYRKGCVYGALAHYKVNVDGKQVATMKNNSIYTEDISTGAHTIGPRQSKREVSFNAEPGQTYVVVYKTRIGILGGRPRLKVMTLDEAKMHSKYFKQHIDHKMAIK